MVATPAVVASAVAPAVPIRKLAPAAINGAARPPVTPAQPDQLTHRPESQNLTSPENVSISQEIGWEEHLRYDLLTVVSSGTLNLNSSLHQYLHHKQHNKQQTRKDELLCNLAAWAYPSQ